MKRWTAIVVAGMLVLAAHSGGASAEREEPRARRLYDPKTVETVSGEVKSVEQVQRGRNRGRAVQVTLETAKGAVIVHLGPAWFLQEKHFSPKAGDKLQVTGSRVTVADHQAILAAEVHHGETVLHLRDATGQPAWARRGERR